MYDNSNNNHTKPTTIPMFPRTPEADDPRWRDVAVRSRTQSQTNIKRFPTDVEGIEITTIYAGDTISIMPEVQFHYFVAARVGYHIGWVNFKHVKLVSLQSRGQRYLEETKPQTPINRDELIAQRKAEMYQRAIQDEQQENHQTPDHYAEEETQPAPAQKVERAPAPIARNDVQRIINKLKNLGGLFSRK